MNDKPEPQLAVKRYPILRIIAILYKFMAVVVTLISLSVTIAAIFGYGGRGGFIGAAWYFGFAYLVSGGFAGISFYAISRLIELFLETNDNTRLMAEKLEEQNKILKQIYARQGRPPAPVNEAIAARHARLNPDK